MTLLCVPILVTSASQAMDDAAAAKAAGADLVEYRLDEFFQGDLDAPEVRQILSLIAGSPLPCIATCRPVGPEGGAYDGPDDARISLFERLGTAFAPGESPPRYLDVELSTLQRSANIRQKVRLAVDHPEQLRDLRTSLIVSSHDFAGRPADLTRRLAAMRDEPAARVLKLAFRARSLRDNLELFDLLAESGRPTIALGMGEFGLMSRVLAPKFNAFLTFAALRADAATAPGQPTLDELLTRYRFRSITPATRVFGVIGYPVAHSLSPHVHNAGFAAVGRDAVYLPLPVAAGPDDEASFLSLKATLLELLEHPRLTFSGASVTIPHKENLLRLAREQGWRIDEPAAHIGAANTLVADRGPDGSFRGARVSNTDAPAIARVLRDAVGDLSTARVALVGAGGVARAAAYALAREGASVTIYNRTPARAQKLADELRPHVRGELVPMPLDALAGSSADVYINGTPAGLAHSPQEHQTPIPLEHLRACPPATVVFDTVYTPHETRLLREAVSANLRVIHGVSMFAAQAEAQFSAFAGEPPPPGLFDRIARAALQPTRTG